MEREALSPEQITPLPGSTAAAVAWRSKGQLHITVVVKATFTFAPDGPMLRTEPQEILRAEVHHGNNPGRSIRLTSDLAPYLGRADVLFTGSACAPPGGPVRSLPVRLAIFAAQRPLLDKWLIAEDPAGFERMPIVYERAPRGADDKENPLGVAAGAGEPNIKDPGQPERPAGFGPIGRAWPARKRLLGGTSRAALDGPIAQIPEGFDWAYFQAAPPDQWIDFLNGDEWIVLEGLHPSLPLLRTCLPGAVGRARVHGLSAFGVREGAPLELTADTLRIDGDAQRCTVVWRRSFPVTGEEALSAVRVVAGVEVGGEALVWTDPPAITPRAPVPTAPLAPVLAGTLNLSSEEEAAARRPVLPFAAPLTPQASPPPAPHRVFFRAEQTPFDSPPVMFKPSPAPAPPSPVVPPAMLPLGLRAASDAAAGVTEPERVGKGRQSEPPPVEEPAAPEKVIDLLWFEPRSVPRIRKQPAWRAIVEALEDEPLDPDIDDPELAVDPTAAEERREVFEVLAKGEAMGEEALRGAVKGAVRRDGRFVAPLVLIEGELSFPFDEMAVLEATVAVVGPLVGEDEGLKTALAAGRDFLSAKGPLSSRSAALGHSAAIKAAYGSGKRALPLVEVEAQIEEGLLDQRRYQRRAVFGGPMLRGLLRSEGAGEAVPVYLPEALAEALPMFQRFRARVIAEAHLPADQREKRGVALKGVAVARVGV